MQLDKKTNYKRVLPRDLFNEAKLLKCVGKIVLLIEDEMMPVTYHYDNTLTDNFIVGQNQSDGSFFVKNISFFAAGKFFDVVVYQNKNEMWNAYAHFVDGPAGSCLLEEIPLFTELGDLSEEFLEFCETIKKEKV